MEVCYYCLLLGLFLEACFGGLVRARSGVPRRACRVPGRFWTFVVGLFWRCLLEICFGCLLFGLFWRCALGDWCAPAAAFPNEHVRLLGAWMCVVWAGLEACSGGLFLDVCCVDCLGGVLGGLVRAYCGVPTQTCRIPGCIYIFVFGAVCCADCFGGMSWGTGARP